MPGYFSEPMVRVATPTPQFTDVTEAARLAEQSDPLKQILGTAGDVIAAKKKKAAEAAALTNPVTATSALAGQSDTGFFSKLFGA